MANTRRTPQTSTGRLLVESVGRYAAARNLQLGRHSHDWILTLSGDGRTRLIHGYDLGANTSAAAKVASDKSATYDVLTAAGVPSVPHRVFLHPRFLDFVPVAGNWGDLIAAFVAFGGDAVIKDNEGTGGMEVFRVRSVRELEQRTHQLFQIARAVALSPYLRIASERRFVMLGDSCLFAYSKERATVTGDGRRSVGELMGETKVPLSLVLDGVPADMVPTAGQVVPLQWRHNLGLGARAVPVDPASAEQASALAIARRAMAALGLRFASVDIAAVDRPTAQAEELVMEVNAGVMLEVLARSAASRGEDGTALADAIYHRVLDEI